MGAAGDFPALRAQLFDVAGKARLQVGELRFVAFQRVGLVGRAFDQQALLLPGPQGLVILLKSLVRCIELPLKPGYTLQAGGFLCRKTAGAGIIQRGIDERLFGNEPVARGGEGGFIYGERDQRGKRQSQLFEVRRGLAVEASVLALEIVDLPLDLPGERDFLRQRLLLLRLLRRFRVDPIERCPLTYELRGDANMKMKSIPQGAATTLYAATAPELEGRGGVYLEDCHVAFISDEPNIPTGVRSYALNADDAKRLWELSERLVNQAFSWD
ncbi:MAG: hypothetical protein HXY22_04000 [Alphaproteobacteria bacterium]|nr:hypothetical protein [Alphaproteobacteria bacterium]